MDIQIREAIPADAQGIAKVHVDSWRTSYKSVVPKEILSRLSYAERQKLWDDILSPSRTDTRCFVAETLETQIVGFACGGLEREGSREYKGEIHSIYLLEGYQRMGLGRKLLLSVAGQLRSDGIGSVLLWVFEDNRGARRFYESLGGNVIRTKIVNFGGTDLVEVAYGWKDITALTG